MSIDLALYQPDIPQNTGTLLRLGACLDCRIHIIHPTGFAFSEKGLKRAAMDYMDHVRFSEYDSFSAFEDWRKQNGRRLVLLTTKAEISGYAFEFSPKDILLVGRESAGVPTSVAEACDSAIRIPMKDDLRSINVAISAALMLGEALRQTNGFNQLT